MTEMTSRERLLTAFAHRQPDRCPTYIWYTPGGMERLMSHLQVDSERDVCRILQVDREEIASLPIRMPPHDQARLDALIPSEFRDSDAYKIDPMGRVLRVHHGVDVLEDIVWNPLGGVEHVDELERYPLPRPEWIRPSGDLSESVAAHKESGALVRGEVEQVFKLSWLVRGMQNILMDFLINEDIIRALYDVFYAFNTACASVLVRAGVDMIVMNGDLGMQDRLMMSPETWRRFDKPLLADMIRTLKGINPDVKLYMHTDGNVRSIIGDLIEAGLDILNPIQPECMDPVEIKREFGDRLVLHGGVSLQRTLPFGVPEDVKAEVRHLIRHCNVDGGFVLGPSNEIFTEIPPENVVAMYDAAREFAG